MGSKKTDNNEKMVEEMLDCNRLVYLNEERYYQCKLFQYRLNITIKMFGNINASEIWGKYNTIGSDHYPITCKIGMEEQNYRTEIIDEKMYRRKLIQ